MTLSVGGLNLDSLDDGYQMACIFGDPITGVPTVSGQRVLIPGRVGFYTPSVAGQFEARSLLIGIKGLVTGEGADHEAIVASFASRFAALRTACDVATRQDVAIENDGWTIGAGFLRFEHPFVTLLGVEAVEVLIEFEATDPPEWVAAGS